MLFFRALLSLVFSSFKVCFVMGLLLGFIIALMSAITFEQSDSWFDVLLAPPIVGIMSAMFGPFAVFPALIIGAAICRVLVVKGRTDKKHFILSASLVCFGTALVYYISLKSTTIPAQIILAGPFVGWLTWKDQGFFTRPTHPKIEKEDA